MKRRDNSALNNINNNSRDNSQRILDSTLYSISNIRNNSNRNEETNISTEKKEDDENKKIKNKDDISIKSEVNEIKMEEDSNEKNENTNITNITEKKENPILKSNIDIISNRNENENLENSTNIPNTRENNLPNIGSSSIRNLFPRNARTRNNHTDMHNSSLNERRNEGNSSSMLEKIIMNQVNKIN
jgi:hypothetical protein